MRNLFIILLLICFRSEAEIYKDFVPYTTIAEMKAKYPNAKFEVVKAAWVQENDIFLKITGAGLAGTTYVATSKISDNAHKEKIERYQRLIAESPDKDNSLYIEGIARNERYLALPADDRYSIDWLRWVPDVNIPLERLKAKFGEPSKFDYSESDFQPYAEWTKRGLRANLSDDKKIVYSIEYYFTDEEYDRALGIEPAPAEVAEPPKQSSKKPKSKTKAK